MVIGSLVVVILAIAIVGFSYDWGLLHYGLASAILIALIGGMNLADQVDPRAAPAEPRDIHGAAELAVAATKKKIDWLVVGLMMVGTIGLVVIAIFNEWRRSEASLAAAAYFAIFVLAARHFGKLDRKSVT